MRLSISRECQAHWPPLGLSTPRWLIDVSVWPDHQASRPGRAQSADLERDLASGVPGSDPRQCLAGLVERQYGFGLRAEFAGIDKGGQLLKPWPGAAGRE